ncbi:MAG: hypothetical protein NZ877_06275 [Sulfolobales archaeon]|nr:hypothetical protein [Sulfolobales archaeon]
MLIIPTRPYSEDEIREIIKIRAEEEEISLSNEALKVLVETGSSTSLRYAVQLLQPARIVAESEGRSAISVEDVERAKKLFIDVSQSVQYLKHFEDKFLK